MAGKETTEITVVSSVTITTVIKVPKDDDLKAKRIVDAHLQHVYSGIKTLPVDHVEIKSEKKFVKD